MAKRKTPLADKSGANETFLHRQVGGLGDELVKLAVGDASTATIIDKLYIRDGWARFDGSCGIRIVDVDDFFFDDIQITEVAA